MVIIIALTGKHGVGKTTLANYFVTNLHFTLLSIATPLKKCCAYLFDISENYFLDSDKKDCIIPEFIDASPRDLLQIVGTNVIRDHLANELQHKCPEFSKLLQKTSLFPLILKRKIENYIELGIDRIIIDDLRFMDEVEMLLTTFSHEQVKIIRLVKNEDDDKKMDNHRSETEQNNIACDLNLLRTTPETDAVAIMNL